MQIYEGIRASEFPKYIVFSGLRMIRHRLARGTMAIAFRDISEGQYCGKDAHVL